MPDNGPLDMSEVKIDDVEVEETPVVEKTVEEVVEVDDNDEITEELSVEDLTDEQRLEILDAYFPLPDGFPDKAQLDAWETQYGRIRVHRIGAHDAYVVRALTRSEFRKYLEILRKKFGDTVSDPTEERMVQEELLVERCTLWPTVTGADIRGESSPVHKIGLAGTASILAFDIQEISNLVENNVGPFEEL
jgi:hypothetical protein